MSGVEIAGFVLGGFPICISALEHYRDAANVVGQFWQIRRDYKKWMHSLNICKLAFEQNLEEFLLPLIADEDDLQQLIAAPNGPQWKNPELETRLRERLPKSYDLYLESIDHIKDVMNDLMHELGVEKTGFQSKVSAVELRTILDTSDRIAALKCSRGIIKKSSVSRGLWQFWRYADKLYNALTKSWQCECKEFHRTNLLLQHRTTAKVDFRIMFVFAQKNFNAKPWSWTWQEMNIKMLENEAQLIQSSVNFTTTPIVSTESISTLKILQGIPAVSSSLMEKKSTFTKSILRKFKGDKFDTSLHNRNKGASSEKISQPVSIPAILLTPLDTPRVTFTDNSQPVLDKAQVDIVDISDLCDTIATNHPNYTRLGCLRSGEYRFSLKPLESCRPTANVRDTISLDSLLRKDCGIKLTRRQRYFIALTLASSHLQLDCTPWISSQWNKKDILFLRDHDNPNNVLLDQPYISRNITPVPNAHKNPHERSLSSLGIMLLELCFGTALEDNEIRKKYVSSGQAPNPFLDLAAALEWCHRAVEEAGPEFADAILWCFCSMPRGEGEIGKMEKSREELYVKVVVPLQYCYGQFSMMG